MFSYLGLTSWDSFCPNFTRFGVVEPYQANLGLSVLRYKTGFVLISQGSIISHDWRHAENIIPHFFLKRKLFLRYLSISGSRKHLISIWGCKLSQFRTQAPYVYVVLASWNSPYFTWFGLVEAHHANSGVCEDFKTLALFWTQKHRCCQKCFNSDT